MHRRFFAALASGLLMATGLTLASGSPTAVGAVSCERAGLETLGPASVTSPVVGAATDGSTAYLVSRGLSPASVGVYDLSARTVTDNITLPSGDGGWGATLSGGEVYVGTYGSVADVYRVDPATREVDQVLNLPEDTFVWDLATARDGTVVAGSSPTGRVHTYDPSTGQVRNYGAADPAEMYVRSVEIDDSYIYAGTGTHANLVRIDRATGERQSILPPELRSESWVYSLALGPGVIVAGTEPSGRMAVIDRDDPDSYTVVNTGKRTVDQLDVADGAVWLSTRSDGSLMRYDLASGELTPVAQPSPGEETRLVHTEGDTIVGVTGSGAAWHLNRSSGQTDVIDLQTVGLRAGPEVVQSLAASDGRAYVGGHWSLTEHQPDRGLSTRLRVPGEPKAMAMKGGTLHLAEYPGGTIGALNRRQHYETVGAIPKSAVQNRPRDVYYDHASRRLLVASMAEYGHLDGALTTFDPRTGDVQAYRGIVDDQTVNSVVTHRGIAYVSTQIGSSGIEPTTTEAHLAALNPRTGDVLWRDVPLPAVSAIRHVEFLDGLLYAYAGDGRIFSYDPRTRTVLEQVTVGGAGEVEAWRGRLFAATGDAILELDPTTLEPTTLASCLGGGWHNEPQLAIDGDEAMLYTLDGRQLARLPLQE